VVRERIESAAAYGFDGERDLHRFINLSCYLGLDFERRPELSWVVELLLSRPMLDLGDKIEMIIRVQRAAPALTVRHA
jgi:hypothetical protein